MVNGMKKPHRHVVKAMRDVERYYERKKRRRARLGKPWTSEDDRIMRNDIRIAKFHAESLPSKTREHLKKLQRTWTPEMREAARQRSLNAAAERKSLPAYSYISTARVGGVTYTFDPPVRHPKGEHPSPYVKARIKEMTNGKR